MMFKNEFIAVKTQCINFSPNCILHVFETMSMEEFNNKTINENLTLGSNVFYHWDVESNDNNDFDFDNFYYYCSAYIADYEPTAENLSFFPYKPLSKKDLNTLNKIPLGGVFTFTYISELRLPNNIKDISQYNISKLEKSCQFKNIKIYEDQKVNSIILSLINDYKEKRFIKNK